MFALYDYNNDKKIKLSDLAEICEEITRLNHEKIKIEFTKFNKEIWWLFMPRSNIERANQSISYNVWKIHDFDYSKICFRWIYKRKFVEIF